MSTKKILITGATGNVGLEVIRALRETSGDFAVLAGVRNVKRDTEKLKGLVTETVAFDFENETTQTAALGGCGALFLLRPPQLADVKKYFAPLIEKAQRMGVKHVVFLSVQGVENSKFIPHQIEKLIVESGIPYIFLHRRYRSTDESYFCVKTCLMLYYENRFAKDVLIPLLAS